MTDDEELIQKAVEAALDAIDGWRSPGSFQWHIRKAVEVAYPIIERAVREQLSNALFEASEDERKRIRSGGGSLDFAQGIHWASEEISPDD